ncbi:protein phosphatase 2C domain-containing protein [Streptomyces sp. NPDC018036]|uniref:protein phosphatase 2C domain-containing protein n=1 Tax=Streptomyces sp. NPDC018036 TaxID=3365035 RepID=UPI0037B61822
MTIALVSLPATPDAPNEDFAAASPGAAVLLDGAGVAGGRTGCEHGVAWFSSTLGGVLLGTLVAQPGLSLAECLGHAIHTVRSLHGGDCDLRHPASPTSTVIAARVRAGALEYVVLGDSTLLLAGRDGTVDVVTDRRLDEVGKRLRGPVDALPTGSPEHAAALADYRSALTGLRNRPEGFWIAGPDPEAAQHALAGSVPLYSLASVVLMSDGATRLADRFELATWDELFALVAASGPAEVIRRVRDAEAEDPAGRRWPRGKARDDATVLHWALP